MKAILTFLACILASALLSQSNINQSLSVNGSGAAADPSAQLDVSSGNKGMLVPRMTTGERTAIASPANGLLVYDINLGGFWFFNGTSWQGIGSVMAGTPSLIADADGNTKVQTEKNSNEDIIRFDLGGTENMVLRKNAAGIPRLELTHVLNNTFVGLNAGQANTTGSDNTASGESALSSNMLGSANTASGREALYSNMTGSDNTASGWSALYSNTIGNYNMASGSAALFENIDGNFNTASGLQALYSNLTGNSNTAIGDGALYFAMFSANTAIGASAGTSSNNSTTCSYIGYDADNDISSNTYSNSTALGNASRMTGSNQVRTGNASVTSIGGFQNWTNVSDGRFKKDVQENVPGLAFIQKLRPVTYHLDAHGLAKHLNEDLKNARDPQADNTASEVDLRARDEKTAFLETGFIAQEVAAAAKELGYAFSGVDAPENQDGLYGLRYAGFVVPLVKAVQEQQVEIENLKNLEKENAALKAQVLAQAAQLDKITAALMGAGITVGK